MSIARGHPVCELRYLGGERVLTQSMKVLYRLVGCLHRTMHSYRFFFAPNQHNTKKRGILLVVHSTGSGSCIAHIGRTDNVRAHADMTYTKMEYQKYICYAWTAYTYIQGAPLGDINHTLGHLSLLRSRPIFRFCKIRTCLKHSVDDAFVCLAKDPRPNALNEHTPKM